MAPYDGWRLLDIPIDVIQEADAAMQEAVAAAHELLMIFGR